MANRSKFVDCAHIFCALCCFLEVSRLLVMYFQCKTDVIYHMSKPKFDYLPGITLAFPIIDIVSKRLYRSLSVNRDGSNGFWKEKCREFIYENPGKLANEVKFLGIFAPECKVDLKGINEDMNCRNLTSIKIRVDDEKVYYTFFERPFHMKYDPRFNFSVEATTYFLKLQVKKSSEFELNLCVYVHSTELFSVTNSKCTYMNLNEHDSFSLSYVKKSITHLEHPFTSDCRYYKELHTRQRCFDDCLIRETRKACKAASPPRIPLIVNRRIAPRIMGNEQCFKHKNIFDYCSKQCEKVDCILDHYDLKMISRKRDGKNYLIKFYRPLDAIFLEFIDVPRMTTIDAITYIAGSLGFWFGFSIYSFLIPLHSKLKKMEVQFLNNLLGKLTRRPQKRAQPQRKRSKSQRRIINTNEQRSSRIAKIGLIIVCIILCVSQNIKILKVYFNRELIVDISMEKISNISLPAFTIVENIREVLNASAICEFLRINCENVNSNKLKDDIASNSRHSYKLINELVSRDRRIAFAIVKSEGNRRNFSEPLISFYNDLILYTYFYRNSEQDNYFIGSSAFIWFIVNEKLIEKKSFADLFIFIHSPISNPNLGKLDSEFVSVTSKKLIFFNFYLTKTITLLKKPYSTNCRNYIESDYTSRQHCIDTCMNLRSYQLCKSAPKDTFIPNYILQAYIVRRKSGHCFKLNRISEYCHHKCPESDCYLSFYRQKFVETYKWRISSILFMLTNDDFTFNFLFKPAVNFVDVVIYVEGTLFLWFGLPIVYVTVITSKLMSDLKSTRKVSRNRLNENRFSREKKRKQRRLAALCSHLISFLCLLGCIFQITKVISIYFEYLTFVDIYATELKKSSIPAISLFTKTFALLNETWIKEHGITDRTFGAITYSRNCTFEDMFKLRRKDVIRNCFYIDEHSRRSPCGPPKVGFADAYTYLTLLTNSSVKFRTSSVSKPLVTFSLFDEANNSFFIAYHPPNVTPGMLKTHIQKFYFRKASRISYTFVKISMQLLKSPFKTNCIDYKQIGYATSDNCLENCITEQTLMICKIPPKGIVQYDNFKRFKVTTYRRQCYKKEAIKRKCRQVCAFNDCKHVSYDIKLVANSYSSVAESNEQLIVTLTPNNHLSIRYKFRPQYFHLDLLIYIGNTIGLWFGLSVRFAFKFFLLRRAQIRVSIAEFTNTFSDILTDAKQLVIATN